MVVVGVPQRVVADLKCGLEFVITVDIAETVCCHLQQGWACCLFGFREYRIGRSFYNGMRSVSPLWYGRVGTNVHAESTHSALFDSHHAKRILSLMESSTVRTPSTTALLSIERCPSLYSPLMFGIVSVLRSIAS